MTTTTMSTPMSMGLRHGAAALLVFLVGACKGEPDACEQLQPTVVPLIERQVRIAAERMPKGKTTFQGMFVVPGPPPVEREIAQIRSRFVGACRKVGATELKRCVERAQQQQAMPSDQVPADDPACEQLGDAFNAELYRGFGE